MIRSKLSSPFRILVGVAVVMLVLSFAASTRLAAFLMPQVAHIFNETSVICRYIGSAILDQARASSPVFILTFLVVLVFLVLFVRIARQIFAISRFQKSIQAQKLPLPPSVYDLLCQIGVLPSRVVLYESHEPSVFCTGFFQPKIYFSSALIYMINRSELYAVLAHEAAHLRSYDPLRIFVTTLFENMFWFVPVVPQLAKTVRLAQEAAADRYAVDKVGKRNYLATILTLDKLTFIPVASNALGFNNLLNNRVSFLLGKPAKHNWKTSMCKLAISAAIVSLLAFFTFAPRSFISEKASAYLHINSMCSLSYSGECCGVS